MPILQLRDSSLTTAYVTTPHLHIFIKVRKRRRRFFTIFNRNVVHGNDLTGSRGEIASPLFPYPYIHREDFAWRVTVDPDLFVRLFFYNQFSIERDSDSGTCISALLVHFIELLIEDNNIWNLFWFRVSSTGIWWLWRTGSAIGRILWRNST